MPESNIESKATLQKILSSNNQEERRNNDSGRRDSKDKSFRVTKTNPYIKHDTNAKFSNHEETLNSYGMDMNEDILNYESGRNKRDSRMMPNEEFLDFQEDKSTKLISNIYKMYNFTFPGVSGKVAKMTKVNKMNLVTEEILLDILKKFKFEDPNPVVVISGGRDIDVKRSKFLGGIARAAFNTDAVVIDSGVGCGIEYYCARRNIRLFGVVVENETIIPKMNKNEKTNTNELAYGHTHLFMINDKSFNRWGHEAGTKMMIAENIA